MVPGSPAFPTDNAKGLNKRDYIAIEMMAAILSQSDHPTRVALPRDEAERAAKNACIAADALINELNS